ncbi:MAG: hypothetical protein V3V01_17345 [Acidimicrobiales bacterium]
MLDLPPVWTSLHRLGAAILVILIGLQAVIAGQFLFGDWGIDSHAALGNAAFTVAFLIAAIAFAKLDGAVRRVIAVVILVLLTAQIGLGYTTRTSGGAAALHIPLGVAVFGAVLYQLLAAWPALIRTTVSDTSLIERP